MDSSRTIEQKKNYYHREIARRTPPLNSNDEFMRKVYQGLIDDIEWFLKIGGSPMAEVPEQISDLDKSVR